MKRRIYKKMCILSGSMVMICAVLMLCIFYNLFKTQIETQMAREAASMVNALNMFGDAASQHAYMDTFSSEKPMRLTLIDSDGSVIYDNMGNADEMGNHMERPEVYAAAKDGTGMSSRMSGTVRERTYYYAVRLNDKHILRLAYTTRSMIDVFLEICPMIILCILICFIISLFVAKRMTAKIVRPINSIDLQHPEKGCIYEELKPLLMRIGRQNDERQKSEQMRQEFSSNVSHELKTPLTSISGYAELIKNGLVSSDDTPMFADKIYKEAQRMINLVNDIIKISRLDEHRIGIEKENVDLLKIVLEVTERLDMLASRQKISIQVSGAPTIVSAVPLMMDELIYNLCENAIKYNRPGGRVHITVGEEDGRGRIEVSDNGIGIPKACQDRVFERFFRVDKSHSRQTGGTGLGLAIVKHVVEYHSGDIYLSSEEGRGTKIVILL